DVLRMLGWNPQSVPRRDSPGGDAAFRSLVLQSLDRSRESLGEYAAIHLRQLRLDVVKVVEVHRLETEVRRAARDLVAQVRRSDAVATLGNLAGRSNSRGQEGLLDVTAARTGILGVVREIAALGRDEDLVAPGSALGECFRERPADRALAHLS